MGLNTFEDGNWLEISTTVIRLAEAIAWRRWRSTFSFHTLIVDRASGPVGGTVPKKPLVEPLLIIGIRAV